MAPSHRTVVLCFVAFSVAQVISLLGDRLHQFSVIGMIGRIEPGSEFELFMFALFSHAPIILFAPVIGHLIDRSNKVTVLILVDIARGLLVLCIPWLYGVMGTLYAFYSTVFFLAILNLAFTPAKSAVIPELFGSLKLLRLNSILWALGIVGTLGGFLLGGWLFDYRSWEWSFYADGASYLLSVIFLLPLFILARDRGDVHAHTTSAPRMSAPSGQAGELDDGTETREDVRWYAGVLEMWRSIVAGFGLARDNRRVKASLLVQTALLGLLGVVYVVGVAHIQTVFPPEKTMYLSAIASSGMVGLLVGAGVTAFSRRHVPTDRLIGYAALVFAAAWIGVAFTQSFVSMIAWVFLMGMSFSPPFVITETILQMHTPEAYRGRIFATREILIKLAFLGSSSLAAVAGLVVSKPAIMVFVGLLLAVTSALLLRGRFLEFRIVSQEG